MTAIYVGVMIDENRYLSDTHMDSFSYFNKIIMKQTISYLVKIILAMKMKWQNFIFNYHDIFH